VRALPGTAANRHLTAAGLGFVGQTRPPVSRTVPRVTLSGTHGAELAQVPKRTREFRPVSRRGGMAEWSMAVVLKTELADLEDLRFSA
jgi:hypothetical protein